MLHLEDKVGLTTTRRILEITTRRLGSSGSRTHLVQAHTWFAARPDFQMHKAAVQQDPEDPEWALI